MTIHETAIVDAGAEIGAGTKIWHWSHICAGARIGRDCSIGQNVFVSNKVKIGNGCKIQNNVSVYDNVTLEDEVFCGPSMVFTNVINPRAAVSRKDEYLETLVKKGATIGANATIICGNTLGSYCFIAAGALVNKDVGDFELVAGLPARRIGWISKYGQTIPKDIDLSKGWRCEHSGELYVLKDNQLRCLKE